MVSIALSTKSLLQRRAQAYVFFLEQGADFAQFHNTARELYPQFAQAAKQRGFMGKAGTSLVLTGMHKDKPVYLIFLGLGELKGGYGNIETYRRALGTLVRIAESHKLNSITFDLPDPAYLSLSYGRLAQETSTILHKAEYHFDEYITNEDRKITWDIDATIGVPKKYEDDACHGVDIGIAIADSINTARYWCDMPPSDLPPAVFAKQAVAMAKEYGLKATVFDQKKIEKLGMGGIEGVCRGSMHDARFVILEYKAKKAKAPTLALVGKGVTFDTGGLCIKPSTYMLNMKDDMAGAAVVLSAMKLIAQLKPEINVVAFAPMVENMPSGSAVKPGDVLTAYNGVTMEVIDTDAEGRLILADALAYAVKEYKPTAIIDFATLTGACAHALGVFYAGVFSQHDELTSRVLEASDRSGDRAWRMPLDDDYKKAIRSDIADIQNIGNRKYLGGAITAAAFLQNFVGDTPWVHMDTAGVAFGMPDMSYLRPGATGFGIRLIAELVMHWD